jgi:2-dehydro-3-deoxy-L-rhamnonate dehydrogenase (NAD+)
MTSASRPRGALVTGAARGIGLAIARRLARAGARMAMADLDAGELEKAVRDVPGAVALAADVTDSRAVERMVADAGRALGQVDILVNNAGIAGTPKPIAETGDRDWDAVLAVDLSGVFYACRAVVPGMVARRFGRIVNIASIAGKEGNPNAIPYAAAKAGVIGLTKALGKELAQTGILVNCVTPALIETDILKQHTPEFHQYLLARIPMGRMGQPEEVAELVAWLCSDACSFSTGAVFDISGGRATY